MEPSILIAVMFGFTYQSIASFFPTFLVDYRGLSTPTAGVTFGATFILSSGAQVATGCVSDALTRDAALAMSALVASFGLVVLLFVPGTSGVIVGTVLLGLGIS
jgi:MFS family permease